MVRSGYFYKLFVVKFDAIYEMDKAYLFIMDGITAFASIQFLFMRTAGTQQKTNKQVSNGACSIHQRNSNCINLATISYIAIYLRRIGM